MEKLNYEKVFCTLVDKTREYIQSNNLGAMVLGISGGIDSTVVAAICHEVSKNTGIPLIGRSLPIKNKGDEFDVSKLVGEAFCDEFKVCPMTRLYHAALKEVYQVENMDRHESMYTIKELETANGQTPIANGNIQARLRMMFLYNLASIHKGLVMSTDNQTEYQLGFWTLHGDVGDFNPLFGLWKTEVYDLARWIEIGYIIEYKESVKNNKEDTSLLDKGQAIHRSIALTPTDGLGISNSDLEQIGAKSYNEVDDILRCLIFYGEKVPQPSLLNFFKSNLQDKYGKEVVNKVWNRHLTSEFKRKNLPIVIERRLYA